MATADDSIPKWWTVHWQKVLGFGATAAAIATTVILAVRSAGQPSGLELALFAVVAACFQVGAGLLFSRTGQVDLPHAEGSVRRLVEFAVRAETAKDEAERVSERGVPASEVRDAMLKVSVELSVFEQAFINAGLDWTNALPELLRAGTRSPSSKEIADE